LVDSPIGSVSAFLGCGVRAGSLKNRPKEMIVSTRTVRCLAFIGLLLPAWPVGCSQAPTLPGGANNNNNGGNGTIGSGVEPELTADQEKAVNTALSSASGLAQAVNTSQTGATAASDDGSAQAAPELQFGTCPVVTLATEAMPLVFTITVDFGAACAPAVPAGAVCSGSASGTIDASVPSLDLTFDSISCGGDTLDGSTSLTYLVADGLVTLDGAWALAVTHPGDEGPGTTTLEGGGLCSYDGALATVEIEEFAATISNGTEEWELTANGLRVELSNADLLVPYGGTITVTAAESDTIVLVFDEFSPVTGEVTVSINDGPSFTVNVFELP